MSKPMPSLADCMRIYVLMQASVARAEEAMLQLMRHPEATPEMLAYMNDSYARWHAEVAIVKAKLQARFPQNRTLIQLPWSMK